MWLSEFLFLNRLIGSCLFCCLFSVTRAISHNLTVNLNDYGKAFIMIRSLFTCKYIFNRLKSLFLYKLLKNRFAVIKKLFMFNIIQNKIQNKFFRIGKTTVQVDCAKKCLCRIGNDRITVTSSCHVFSLTKKQKFRKTEFSCAICQAWFTHKTCTFFCQLTFRDLRKFFVKKITADQFKYSISKKLQTFITSKFSEFFFICIRTVCQRLSQQFFVLKCISYNLFQLFHFIVLLFLFLIRCLKMNRLNTFCNFFVDLLLFELHTLENSMFDLNCLCTSMGFHHQTLQAQKRCSSMLTGIKGFQSGFQCRLDQKSSYFCLQTGHQSFLHLLDQCAAAGGTVDSRAVLEVLGLAGNLQTAQLMRHILDRNAQAALLLLNELYAGGKDVGAVLGELSTLTRDLLLRKTAPEGGAALLSGGFDSATLDQLGKDVPSNRFLYLASTLQKAAADLYYSADRRTDAELCLLRLCDESLCGDLTALENRITRLEDAAARGAAISAAVNQRVSAAKAIGAAPVSQAPAKPASKSVEPPPAEAPPPWDEPPLPEEPPMREEPGERVFDIPEDAISVRPAQPKAVPAKPTASISSAPKPQTAVHSAAPVSGDWWKALSENCKGQIPPMYRAFLDLCGGVLEGDQLTVFAPDEITLNRLDNDRVRGVLSAEAEKVSGQPVRLLLREGEPPKPSPEENLKQLLQFGSQFDNIEIK